MNWTTIKSKLAGSGVVNRMMLFAVLFAGSAMLFAQTGTGSGSISAALCSVVSTVQFVIGIVAILLFVLGGVIYAIAHMMPSAGQFRGSLQGWSMGMIVGGIVGLILVILAPGLISFIITVSGAGGSVNLFACGG